MVWLIVIFFSFLFILFGFRLWYHLSGLRGALKYSSVLMLHGIHERFDFSISGLKRGQFLRLLEDAEKMGYTFERLSGAVSSGWDKPADNVLRISFDDGYGEIYDLFEQYFRPRSIPITIFMTSGYIGKNAEWDYLPRPARHLDEAQLKRLSASELVTIGSHSVTHPNLSAVSRDRLTSEVVDSKKYLEDLLGAEIKYFSYPFGRFNPRVMDEVVKAGYQAAFCGVPFRRYARNKLFQIPRIPLYHLDNFFTFTQKVEPGRLAWLEFSKARVIEQFSGLTFRMRGERKWSNS